MLRLTLAALHLLALGIGLGGIWGRARGLGQRPLDLASVRRAFAADSWWGIAAILWIATGLWRLLAGTEKTTSYYTHDALFLDKMRIFGVIFLLEIWPMITLIRWRGGLRQRREAWRPDEATARRISVISYIQVALLLLMIVAAVSMARGYGYQPAR
jgi:putative membrane protein